MKINPTSTNFKANPIADAQVYGVDGDYRLYRITKGDIPLLKKMAEKINLPELAPGFEPQEYKSWKNLIMQGISTACSYGRSGILCTYNNKPCGVLNYTKHEKENFVYGNYTATWPVEKFKKVPLANKAMFYALFNEISKKPDRYMKIDALIDSPYHPVIKYLHLGFLIKEGDMPGVQRMEINHEGIDYALKALAERIKYTPHKFKLNVNLKRVLNLVV